MNISNVNRKYDYTIMNVFILIYLLAFTCKHFK